MDSQSIIDDLLTAARNGDKKSENQLFSLLRARIFDLVQHRIWNDQQDSSGIQQDAEDLTEDICLVICQKYKTTSLGHGFVPWVFQIVRYKIGEYFRERDRKKTRRGSLADEGKVSGSTVAPDLEIEAREVEAIIFHALEGMGQPCAEIIKALLEGEIKAYIKQQRTTAIGTVYAHIHRCRQNLEILLREKGYKL